MTAPSPLRAGGFSDAISQHLNVPSDLNAIFEEAARQYQVPAALLKAVGKAESDFNPGAISHCGAQGVMQLMPATAKSLGVRDSLDPRENIMGGAKYLRDMLNKYDGNTKLALAAYNAGSGSVDKYHGIPPYKETQNYVVKVMDYAGQGMTAIPSSNAPVTSSAAASTAIPQSSDSIYLKILQSIFDFDDFSSEDYLLFLELLQSGLQASDQWESGSVSDPLYTSGLMKNRIQTLY
ncbi:MAG: lytic transglycosylase domain-containing protein [Hungatella sp.]